MSAMRVIGFVRLSQLHVVRRARAAAAFPPSDRICLLLRALRFSLSFHGACMDIMLLLLLLLLVSQC